MKAFSKIRRFIKRIQCEVMYRQAKAKADYASYKRQGDIFYVLPTAKGKLVVINRQMFSNFKRLHLTDNDMKVKDLFRDCVYHTMCRSEKGKENRKRKFLRWKGLL